MCARDRYTHVYAHARKDAYRENGGREVGREAETDRQMERETLRGAGADAAINGGIRCSVVKSFAQLRHTHAHKEKCMHARTCNKHTYHT